MNENTEEVVAPTTPETVSTPESAIPAEAQEKLDSEVDNNAPVAEVDETTEADALASDELAGADVDESEASA